MSLPLATYWPTAAWREAARVGAPKVDVDHLYLGLIGVGGEAARLLGRHGVTLASARSRVRESLDTDLATLGLDAAGVQLPPLTRLDRIGEPPLAYTDRAGALIRTAVKLPDTYSALVALLQEPSGTVRRLVAADGLAPQQLVPELKEGSEESLSAEPTELRPGLLPGPGYAQRYRLFVSVPPDALADAIADPEHLAWWSYDPAKAKTGDDPATVTHHAGRRTLSVHSRVTRTSEADAEVITWLHSDAADPDAGPLRHDRFEVRGAPGGSDLTWTAGHRTVGALGALTAPVTKRFAAWGMAHSALAVAFAAAEQ